MITAPNMDIILSLISNLLSPAVPQSGHIITTTLANDQHNLTMRRLVSDYYIALFSPGRGENDLIVSFRNSIRDLMVKLSHFVIISKLCFVMFRKHLVYQPCFQRMFTQNPRINVFLYFSQFS